MNTMARRMMLRLSPRALFAGARAGLRYTGSGFQSMFCNRCGSANSDQAQFCGGCGSPLSASPAAPFAGASPAAAPYAPAPVFARPGPVRYAGFWLRLVAMIIDAVVWLPAFAVVVAIL